MRIYKAVVASDAIKLAEGTLRSEKLATVPVNLLELVGALRSHTLEIFESTPRAEELSDVFAEEGCKKEWYTKSQRRLKDPCR